MKITFNRFFGGISGKAPESTDRRVSERFFGGTSGRFSVCILMCICIVLASASAACASSADRELTKITVMIFDRGNAPEGESVTDNRWTTYINEKMAAYGIEVEFVPVARDNEVDEVNNLVNSKRAADIMMCYDGPLVRDFYYYGYTMNMAPYLKDDNSKDLREYLGESVLELTTDSDGSMWAVRARRSTSEKYNLFIRKDWLDLLGLEIPQTVEELHDVLVAFSTLKTEQTYSGKSIIPGDFLNSGAVGPLAGSFLKTIGDKKEYSIASLETKGSMVCTDEGYVEYFRYLNRLYNEGLISDSFLVSEDNQEARWRYILEDRLGVFEEQVNGNVDSLRGGLLQKLREINPNADIVSIPPMKNIWDGNVYNPGYSEGGAYLFIPRTCEHPEAAVTYLNWLATEEGGFTLYNGFEGEHFTYENGVPAAIDPEYNKKTRDWIRHDLFIVGNQGYFRTKEDFIKSTAMDNKEYSGYIISNYQNAGIGLVPEISFNSPTNAIQATNLKSICRRSLVNAITCKPEEFDNVIDMFKGQLYFYSTGQIVAERKAYFDDLFGE